MARVQHLFIVRVWQEPGSAATPSQWRGSIEHVPANDRFYFAHLADLLDFITLRLGHAADERPTDPPAQNPPNP